MYPKEQSHLVYLAGSKEDTKIIKLSLGDVAYDPQSL